jgi:methylmalonyl-CoA carboxyltransferase large subunit
VVDVKTDVVEVLNELRAELRTLSARMALLEGERAPAIAPIVAASPPAPVATAEPISEEILLVISAAVAAFLGERVPIRQIRLISSPGWALQGRVFIQASHNRTR